MRLGSSVLALCAVGAVVSYGCASREVATEHAASDDEVWITLDREALPWLESLYGAPAALREPPSAEPRTNQPVAVRVPRRALPDLSEIQHEERHHCGGYMLHEDEADALERLAEIDSVEKQARAPVVYSVDNRQTVEALLSSLDEANVLATVRKLSSYPTRHASSATGEQAARFIYDRWTALATNRTDVRVALVDHAKTPQPSVSLTIRGTTRSDEYVILGGHLDSIAGRDPRTPAPGADDNASGIATLTEVARVALARGYRPERTVVFYAYAAEEVGLVGSSEIAASAKGTGQQVVGVMQLDMTNFTTAPEPYVTFIRDNTDANLNLFGAELVDTYLGIPWKYERCGYACSDHASWTTRGYPAIFPHEATLAQGNKRIHTANDSLALSGSSVKHAMHFVRFGAAFMAELAKGRVDGAAATSTTPTGVVRADAGAPTGTTQVGVGRADPGAATGTTPAGVVRADAGAATGRAPAAAGVRVDAGTPISTGGIVRIR